MCTFLFPHLVLTVVQYVVATLRDTESTININRVYRRLVRYDRSTKIKRVPLVSLVRICEFESWQDNFFYYGSVAESVTTRVVKSQPLL